jgi:sRNA-binding carbon storage regulator CsrA
MLVVSRKETESVDIIINGVKVAVVSVETIGKTKVRIGFEAEPAVTFVRSELMGVKNEPVR